MMITENTISTRCKMLSEKEKFYRIMLETEILKVHLKLTKY